MNDSPRTRTRIEGKSSLDGNPDGAPYGDRVTALAPVDDFIESMLADRAPKAFTAVAEDAEVLRVAIEMCTLRGALAPERQFVENLHKCLAGTTPSGATLMPFPAGVWQQDHAEVTAASAPSRHSRRKAPRRFAAAGKAAAAAVLVAATFTATTFVGGKGPAAAKPQVTSVDAVRSAALVSANGRHLGEAYVYTGNPAWVFMDVQQSGLAGTYTCQLRLAGGTDVKAGILAVGHGSGEWAHTVDVDVSRLRTAALETPAGQVVATATFS
jgi:hypothetical protein